LAISSMLMSREAPHEPPFCGFLATWFVKHSRSTVGPALRPSASSTFCRRAYSAARFFLCVSKIRLPMIALASLERLRLGSRFADGMSCAGGGSAELIRPIDDDDGGGEIVGLLNEYSM
jgi:hypothetical protein